MQRENDRLDELNALSPRSRDMVDRDVRGRDPVLVDEDPAFVADRIQQVDSFLASMKNEDKTSYDKACRIDVGLQTNRALKLKFLRAELFNPGLAAHRITQHFDFVERWFGEDRLGRPIVLDDLDEFDQQTLATGGAQVLVKKDRGGRRLFFLRKADFKFTSLENMLKSLLYMVNTLADSEENQRRGLVGIIYCCTEGGRQSVIQSLDRKLAVQFATYMRFAAPIRVVGLHFLYDDSVLSEISRLIVEVLGKAVRLRFVTHHVSSHQEANDALTQYGIPEDSMPITMGGRIIRDGHLEWLEKRRSLERSSSGLRRNESSKTSSEQTSAEDGSDGMDSSSSLHQRDPQESFSRPSQQQGNNGGTGFTLQPLHQQMAQQQFPQQQQQMSQQQQQQQMSQQQQQQQMSQQQQQQQMSQQQQQQSPLQQFPQHQAPQQHVPQQFISQEQTQQQQQQQQQPLWNLGSNQQGISIEALIRLVQSGVLQVATTTSGTLNTPVPAPAPVPLMVAPDTSNPFNAATLAALIQALQGGTQFLPINTVQPQQPGFQLGQFQIPNQNAPSQDHGGSTAAAAPGYQSAPPATNQGYGTTMTIDPRSLGLGGTGTAPSPFPAAALPQLIHFAAVAAVAASLGSHQTASTQAGAPFANSNPPVATAEPSFDQATPKAAAVAVAAAPTAPVVQPSTYITPSPPQNPQSVTLPTLLYLESDAASLSDYQCFLRQQIEVFEATGDDVQYNASRMNRSIKLGQVGLRCKHCSHSPEWERASGAVYYPGNLNMLYQAGQNMAKNHLCYGCKAIPREKRDLLNLLRGDKRRATTGKEYWSKTARVLGIYEDGSNGLKCFV